MNALSANDIYFHTQIKRRISLNPRYLDENFDQFIKKIVKNNLEGKCIKEGYVVKDSVEIIKRSMGNLNNNQFNGNILFDLIIGAKLCNIPVNSVIKVKVKKMNSMCILAEMGPLVIIVNKDIHQSKEPFKNIKVGNEIELLVIGKTYDLNKNHIDVFGKLNSEAKKKISIPVRKGLEKHKNTDKLMVTESIIEENDDSEEIDDDDLSELDSEDNSSEEDSEEELDGDMDAELIDGEDSLDIDAPPEELLSEEEDEDEEEEEEEEEEEDEEVDYDE